eukprot:1391808-Amorphochlora_amoeboformis.AAC.1
MHVWNLNVRGREKKERGRGEEQEKEAGQEKEKKGQRSWIIFPGVPFALTKSKGMGSGPSGQLGRGGRGPGGHLHCQAAVPVPAWDIPRTFFES